MAGLALLALYTAFVIARVIGFGYPLAVQDDWVLYGATQCLEGNPLYLDPSRFHPVIDIYPPGFIALFVPVTLFFGANHHAAQTLVVLAIVGSVAVMYRLLRHLGLSSRKGLVFILLFCTTILTLSGQTMIQIRPDAFIMLLMAVMILLLLKADAKRSGATALLIAVFCLAVYIKQTAVLFGFCTLCVLVIRKNWAEATIFSLVSGAVIGLVFYLGNALSHGMWYTYLVHCPQLAPYDFGKWRMLLVPVSASLPLWGVILYSLGMRWVDFKSFVLSPSTIFVVVLLPFSLVAFFRYGGGLNQFVPLCFLLTIVLADVYARLLRAPGDRAHKRNRLFFSALSLYCIIAFMAMRRNSTVPDGRAYASAKTITSVVRRLSPRHAIAQCFSSFVYKNCSADFVNLCFESNFFKTGLFDQGTIEAKADSSYYDMMLLIRQWSPPYLRHALQKHYTLSASYPYVDGLQLDLYVRNHSGLVQH